ncbi:MFS transporter [Clostridium sp. Mt-5]|uniref:MFS transporter n=1 Tax=Clostridium moutaii TaxID=3240932 RepID=A0ABV4BQP7_9CLOT
MNTNINKTKAIISIMAVAFLMMGVGATSPALASIGGAFPDITSTLIMLIATLPPLVLVPFSILTGRLAGSKAKYKTLAVIGIIFFVIGGTVPYFLSNFIVILFMRALLGVGLGFITPLSGALIMNLFSGHERENLMGISNVIASVGGIVFQIVGGLLCAINWRDTFLIYLIGIAVLIIVVLMLPEPSISQEKESGNTPEKVKMNIIVYMWAIFYLIFILLTYPMLTGISGLILKNNYGTAATAGVTLTMWTVGSMIGGAIFGKIVQKIKRYVITLSLVFCAIGYVFIIIGIGGGLMFFNIGTTVFGVGAGLIAPGVMYYAGLAVRPEGRAMVMGLVMAFMNLGGFLSAFFFSLVESLFHITADRFPFVFGSICFVIFAVIYGIFVISQSKKKKYANV